jgi:hypothetical protein
VHCRTFPAELSFAEGRLVGRLVPFDATATVHDLSTTGGVVQYVEGFRHGAFSRQATSSEPGVLRRVMLKHEHDGGMGYLGPLVSLDERADGLYGEFRVLPSMREDVAELHSLGIAELSVEFLERKNGTAVDDAGVKWRTDVHLGGVALVPQGAYGASGARVLAMRAYDDLIAEQAAETAAEVEAERARHAAEVAAAEQAEQEAEARRRQVDEIATFLAEAKAAQVELAARFLCEH